MVNVIIVDDHKLVRDGLKSMFLQSDGEIFIVGEAASGAQALEVLERQKAEVVLMDFEMHGMNGVEATRQIRERFPEIKVLMLTMMENDKFINEALQAGAQGYVLKTASYKELVHAILTVAEGEEYFSTDIARMLLQKMQSSISGQAPSHGPGNGQDAHSGGAAAQTQVAAISPRELEVLRLIAKGYTNSQIGEILFNSRRTIETHRQNLLEKTGANNTATLILYAATHGLLD
jgi:DNA-binding NarL/FixJ family response regulator